MWKIYLALIATGGIVAIYMDIWANIRFAEYEWQLAECHGNAQEAHDHRNQLLSGGRFIRRYNPITNASEYTFAAPSKRKP